MKWPASIPVNSCRVAIKFVPEILLPDDRDGDFRNTEGSPQIRVASALKGDYLDFVVCHEIIHAWLRVNGVEADLQDGMEERLADTLGHELARLLVALRANDEHSI